MFQGFFRIPIAAYEGRCRPSAGYLKGLKERTTRSSFVELITLFAIVQSLLLAYTRYEILSIVRCGSSPSHTAQEVCLKHKFQRIPFGVPFTQSTTFRCANSRAVLPPGTLFWPSQNMNSDCLILRI